MRRHFIGLFVIFLGGLASAQGLVNPFDLEPSAEAAGYAGALCALASGADALIFNPAGLSFGDGIEVSSAYVAHMGGLASVVWLGGTYGPFAAAFTNLSAGGIEETPGGSDLPFSQIGAAVGVGLSGRMFGLLLPMDLRFGAAVRYDRAQLADRSGSGLSLSLGLMGTMPLGAAELRFGLAMEDLGFGISSGADWREGWTTGMRAGVAFVTPLLRAEVDYANGLRLGAGFMVSPMLEVRGGLSMTGAGMQFAMGVGIELQSLSLDYALVTHPVFPPTHRLGLSASF